jgi:hypothetical protein
MAVIKPWLNEDTLAKIDFISADHPDEACTLPCSDMT